MTIDYFVWLARAQQADLTRPEPATVRYHFLASQGKKKKEADDWRNKWAKENLQREIREPNPEVWQLIREPSIDLAILPLDTVTVKFTFHLTHPYLSRDDKAFYIIDNPVVQDKVFHLPMVRPSGWKGSLRHALWRMGYHNDGEKQHDERIRRMFGEVQGTEMGVAGRLLFYPTFFNSIGLEIINPHDRKQRVGRNPIFFECVPEGTTGLFTLLYVPFDRIGKDEHETRRQIAEDLPLLTQGLKAMFTEYGFGAKTSSGFGVAEDQVEQGELAIAANVRLEKAGEPEDEPLVEPQMPNVVSKFLEKYPGDDFTLKPNGWREQHQASQKERDHYREARAAYRNYQQRLEVYQTQLEAGKQRQAEEKSQCYFQESFRSFGELVSLSEQLATSLQERANK